MKIIVIIIPKAFALSKKPKTRIKSRASWWSGFVFSESHSASKAC